MYASLFDRNQRVLYQTFFTYNSIDTVTSDSSSNLIYTHHNHFNQFRRPAFASIFVWKSSSPNGHRVIVAYTAVGAFLHFFQIYCWEGEIERMQFFKTRPKPDSVVLNHKAGLSGKCAAERAGNHRNYGVL